MSASNLFTVSSTLAWQNTGVSISSNNTLNIAYVSGLWTANPSTSSYSDANGNPAFFGRPFYTYPGANEGTLIGRIGNYIFIVGDNIYVPQGLSGTLELCINDDLIGIYGAGLTDNLGSLNVEINVN